MHPSAKQPRGVPNTAKMIGIVVHPLLQKISWFFYAVSMIHSTASVTTNPNSVHCILRSPPSYIQFQMVLNGLLHFPWLYPDVSLGHSSAAVLQELLHQRDIIAIVPIDLGGIVFSEAVGADALEFQIVAHQLQLFLHCSFRHRENHGVVGDAVVDAVAANELIEGQGYGKGSGFPGLLLGDRQTIPVPIMDDIAQPQFDDI